MDMMHQHNKAPLPAAYADTSVPFDVLRIMIAARQSASPTSRALAAQFLRDPVAAGTGGLIDIFTRGNALTGSSGRFGSGEPVSDQGDQHV